MTPILFSIFLFPGQYWVWEADGQVDGVDLLPGGEAEEHAGEVLSDRTRARVHQCLLLVHTIQVSAILIINPIATNDDDEVNTNDDV